MIERYLERLFTWESLENTERGVEFELKNRLVETEFVGLTAVRFDGDEVPLDDVTLEIDDGSLVSPEEVSAEEPLVFELADTMGVVADTERLTLGSHEVSMGFEVDGYGRVSFSTDEEVTEDDLLDVEISEKDADEAVALTKEVREPVTLRRILDDESAGDGRAEVVEAVEDRLGEVRHVEERRELVEEGTRFDAKVDDRLSDLFEGRRRLVIYAALRRLEGGTVEDVARETGMERSSVKKRLKEMETDGNVEYVYEKDTYEAVAPSDIVVGRFGDLAETLRRSIRE